VATAKVEVGDGSAALDVHEARPRMSPTARTLIVRTERSICSSYTYLASADRWQGDTFRHAADGHDGVR
jgi:hypothetical protein